MFSRALNQRSIRSWRCFLFLCFLTIYGEFPLEHCDYHLHPDARSGPTGDHEGPHFQGLKPLSELPADRFPQNCRQKFPIFELKFINRIKQQDCYIAFPKRCHDAATSQLLSLAPIKKIFGFPSVSDKLPQLTLASFQSRCGRVRNTAVPRARLSGRRPGCKMHCSVAKKTPQDL